jgi:hypothetical protein
MSAADGSEASTDTVSGRYRIWWSQGVHGPLFAPAPFCAQFFADGTVRPGFCPFSFDSFNLSEVDHRFPDVISAVGARVDLVNGESLAFQGFKDVSCGITGE